ncbi:DUF5133 domain-containing protein [Streptomyces sp. NPDC048566]|uniref:DUF5133 domain-containing protein n=1 Tax=Streptomyces sp. NPDC048566 TaxID=3365569 RepID=UPI0037148CB5
MLVPDPKVVRRLLTRYAALQIAYAEKETLETARRLEDVTYTLCVMTGKTGVHEAVAAADAMLAAAGGRREAGRSARPVANDQVVRATDGRATVPAPMARARTGAAALTGQGAGGAGPVVRP